MRACTQVMKNGTQPINTTSSLQEVLDGKDFSSISFNCQVGHSGLVLNFVRALVLLCEAHRSDFSMYCACVCSVMQSK